MKAFVATAVFALCLASSALAQDAAPPPVESMTCEQMMAELTVAGQQMNAQLDPEFAREAQAMHNEAQQASSGQGQAQPNTQAQVDENHARVNAQMNRLNASMAGIDQQRMMAVAERFEQQNCETPQ